MAERILPKFPSTHGHLGLVSVCCQNEMVVYEIGLAPFFTHAKSDTVSFQFVCCLLYFHDHASQIEMAEFFGVSVRGLKRACKRFKATGPGKFYRSGTPQRRGSTIFTDDFVEMVQESFEDGLNKKEVAEKYNIKIDTLNKAIRDSRIEVKKVVETVKCASKIEVVSATATGSTKSARSFADSQTELGVACTDVDGRILAHLGKLPNGVEANFTDALDVKAPPEGDALDALVDRYRVQSHYLMNDCWLSTPPLLERLHDLPRVPTLLLHADDDRICRPAGAWAVHERIAHSRLCWVQGCGHDPAQPAMAGAMVAALDAYAAHGDFDSAPR